MELWTSDNLDKFVILSLRFYTRDSLIADQDYGPILSSLLVGPCALEYTKIRAKGQIW